MERRLIHSQIARPKVVEAHRMLALQVQGLLADEPRKSILVMSGYRRDGRTTTAVNLAIALTRLGNQVVLVETDVRRPSFGKLMHANGHFSLQRALADSDGASVGEEGPVPGLRILTAGKDVRGGPTDAFQPAALARLCDRLADSGCFIVLDSPACSEYADAFYLAPLVSGVIYVVRRRDQDQAFQQAIRERLAHLNARLLGVVYNEW